MEFESNLDWLRLLCKVSRGVIYISASIWAIKFFSSRLKESIWPEKLFFIGLFFLISGLALDLGGMFHCVPRYVKTIIGEIILSNLGTALCVIAICWLIVEINRISFRLRHQAETDPLTGLFNRRTLFRYLENELAAAHLGEPGPAIAMLDVDNLKKINDNFGHQYGDEALKYIAKAIGKSIRDYDLAVRFGGDEFIILFPRGGPKKETLKARLLKNLDAVKSAMKDIPISLSLGMARFPDDGTDAGALIKEADERMYQDKNKKPPREKSC